jgi:hypothetical protein
MHIYPSSICENGGENYFSHYCGILTPAEPVMEKSVIL